MSVVINTLPNIPVEVVSSEDLFFTSDELSGAPEGIDPRLQVKILEARAEFCKPLPWWKCSEEATQGTCAFVNGECHGVAPYFQKTNYFDKWRLLYGPIYGNMQRPNLNIVSQQRRKSLTSTQPSSARRRAQSVRRKTVEVVR